MMKSIGVVIVLYFFCDPTSVLAATKCYQCSTSVSSHCANLTDTSSLTQCVPTVPGEIYCIMYKYKWNDREIIYRGCRSKSDTCDDIENSLEKENKEMLDCAMCEEDFCKAGVDISTKLTLVLFVTTLIINRLIN